MQQTALLLYSGGQDSTVCLAWALERFHTVETIGFGYNQRHKVELQCRLDILDAIKKEYPAWGGRLGRDHFVDLTAFGALSESSLTRDIEITIGSDGIPNTSVPGRNLAFLVFAAAVAHNRRIRHLVGGMCEADYTGYPDCRDDTLKAMQVAINLGMNERFILHTPLMWVDKARTWDLARQLGGSQFVDLIIQRTHTCFRGDHTNLNAWGYGCGSCPSCRLRADGWESFAAVRSQD